MTIIKSILVASVITMASASLNVVQAHVNQNEKLEQTIAGDHRSAKNKARDQYRHPQQTLEFFGLKPNMTVVEITPGGGWYTEILAPAVKGKGKLYAAQYPDTGKEDYASKSRKELVKMLASKDVYSEVEISDFTPRVKSELAPAGTADMVLTFRNLHNWGEEGVVQVFKDAHRALRIGGVLGVVEHRLPKGADAKVARGYVSEEKTIAQAKAAGFKLAASSEINANPKDLATYKVWTLPPSLDVDEKEKEKYLAIGESDRMTLKFVKIAK